MHVHTLPEGHPILGWNACDPITHRSFRAGDRVVVCRDCGKIFSAEVWEHVSSGHGGRDNTLPQLPRDRDIVIEQDGGRPPVEPRLELLVDPLFAATPPTESGRSSTAARLHLLETVTRPRGARPTVELGDEVLPPREVRPAEPRPLPAEKRPHYGWWIAAAAALAGAIALLASLLQ